VKKKIKKKETTPIHAYVEKKTFFSDRKKPPDPFLLPPKIAWWI
jgi:hypothetical protein